MIFVQKLILIILTINYFNSPVMATRQVNVNKRQNESNFWLFDCIKMVFGAKAIVNTENFVGYDQIWKDHVTNECTSAKQWPPNWGFLIKQYKELCNEDQDVPQGAASVRIKQRRENLRLPPIDNVVKQLGVGPSTRRFPRTTSAEIGWRSTQAQCRLERYGRHSKPLPSFLKSLNWPPESVE